jgi:hypothetical protein
MFDDPRWGDDPRDPDDREHDRDHDDGHHLGRGPSSRDEESQTDPRERADERWPERDRDRFPRRLHAYVLVQIHPVACNLDEWFYFEVQPPESNTLCMTQSGAQHCRAKGEQNERPLSQWHN